MSAAASHLELASPHLSPALGSTDVTELSENENDERDQYECEILEKLTGIAPPGSSSTIIAVDLDDVLSETNQAVSDWHNAIYGTQMDPSNFYYYYYWKNPHWGGLQETFDKVVNFYKTDSIHRATPVPGAREGIQTLKDMGFRLIIVTARQEDKADESWNWITKHFPDIFDSIICTAQFKDAHKAGHEVVTRLSKAQVCHDLGAKFLIDDSIENALQCATAPKPVPVLLFGNYEWNQRLSGPEDARDEMVFETRLKASGGKEFWKEDKVVIPEGAPIRRVKDWSEIVRWVRQARAEGRL